MPQIVNSSGFLLVPKSQRELVVSKTAGVVGEIFTAALDHLGTPNTMRAISHVLGEHYGTSSVLLFGLKTDSSLQLVESFGFSVSIQEKFVSVSLFDALPVPDSIREGKIARFSAAELFEKYPNLLGLGLPHEVFYVVPCTSSGLPLGGLIVGFFTVKNGEELPNMVLQALQVAAFHVLSRQTDLVEVI